MGPYARPSRPLKTQKYSRDGTPDRAKAPTQITETLVTDPSAVAPSFVESTEVPSLPRGDEEQALSTECDPEGAETGIVAEPAIVVIPSGTSMRTPPPFEGGPSVNLATPSMFSLPTAPVTASDTDFVSVSALDRPGENNSSAEPSGLDLPSYAANLEPVIHSSGRVDTPTLGNVLGSMSEGRLTVPSPRTDLLQLGSVSAVEVGLSLDL